VHERALDDRRQIGRRRVKPNELRPGLAHARQKPINNYGLRERTLGHRGHRHERQRHVVADLRALHRGDRDDAAENSLQVRPRILNRATTVLEHGGQDVGVVEERRVGHPEEAAAGVDVRNPLGIEREDSGGEEL
jgi:hypothetical protein